ncbi:class I SAM-dependent DNA methyltransferase [Ornithinimicrobium sp. F0845]|uniref:Eco57I restriction-modification methylase domain-containing protein n=1 Tax=Ornithinimicrobium sp. F0845 TaxID=2926412 RepID=UPI001FF616C6|nr:class I SAM-dependent DNA methyltransferase [Ornithinimicrobium sp. F0845]MCK0114016.1 class I SAM-dependent DNA methyltransferase [Ornithinimicrobium sp. F0845]
MATSDAFVIGEEWISEHYFTSDARNESFHSQVIARRKEWDDEEAETARSRFTEQRGDLERRLGGLAEEPSETELRELYADLLGVLGYRTGEFELATEGSVTLVSSPGLTGPAPLAILTGRPADAVEDVIAKDASTLLQPTELEDGTKISSIARQLSALFFAEDGPEFALALAGRWCLVAERERWPEGRYLAIDLQLVAERNDTKRGGEIDRALTCLAAHSLGPDADGSIWWTEVLAESIKHTVGVSEDLREGVRRSIEIIANEVVDRRRAKGLDPLPADQAQPLAVQSLRYLYRILFLLYAEASPELGVLPTGASEYDAGYGIDRLRELTLVDLHTQQGRDGTHLYESIHLLTGLVDRGHTPKVPDSAGPDGLVFQPLRADLFRPAATAHIDAVGLGNEAVQRVLRHLLLSQEKKGRERGFISYVELGINQLGAVYEGLMSYTGFFAEEDLFEVAKNGDPSKGSWVVPVDRADHLDEKDFVREEDPVTGEDRAVRHAKGSFVFRLAGRERQQSASYYTPEVLTRFTVQQALEELLDQDDQRTSAAEILDLTVCEPALGSGAFALEAVDQLAREYLSRRQDELGKRIDPDEYPKELQKVKAHIALHQVYGVDLNATAVELAEVSLWLSTMVEGLQAPWFGLRLRRGNSLVGARHAAYPAADVRNKSWLKSTPEDLPLADLAQEMEDVGVGNSVTAKVFHFLLPAEGWGSAVEVPKSVRDLAVDEVRALKTWRSSMRRKPTKQQVDRLLGLTQRVEQLWNISLRRLRIAEQESSRSLDLWGRDDTEQKPAVTREQIEESLADADSAYRRLRRVMDAWCALWFWPLTETDTEPPTFDEWLDALTMLLGTDTRDKKRAWMDTFQDLTDWEQLGEAEEQDRIYSGAVRVDAVLSKHPWLDVCEVVAGQQGFFHWELDFSTVFARGGFDLQIGNPPWVRPQADVDALLAEGDAWWQLAQRPSEDERARMMGVTLARPCVQELVLDATVEVISLREYVGHVVNYPYVQGLQPDFYRCFMSQVWAHASTRGRSALLHPESHFTEERGALLRSATYVRLRRHWQFINELKLFVDIHDLVRYGVHVYGSRQPVHFLHAAVLYHPDTVERSLVHDGTGPEPGYKHEGKWDLRPHRGRIQLVDEQVLTMWRDVLEPADVPALATRMVYTVNSAASSTLTHLAGASRIGALDLSFSSGWHERSDRRAGRFESGWGEAEWEDAILQGPHLHVATPFYKSPNPTMKHNQDWSAVDLEDLASDALPVTSYKPAGSLAEYDARYTHWGDEGEVAARDHYRVAWRAMAANTGERTLIPALIPPGTAHIHGIFSAGKPDLPLSTLGALAGVLSSLLSDFAVRAAPKATVYGSVIQRLPASRPEHPLVAELVVRTLQLNCVTDAYADLWNECWDDSFLRDSAVLARYQPTVGTREWTADVPLRRAVDRRNAQVEIDALVALMLDVPIDDLCTIYRTQFAVLHGYDQRDYTYDANGRLVPNSVLSVWRKKGDSITEEERTEAHPGSGIEYTYELPFGTLDREADMRTAYAEFERRLAERSA